MRRCPDRNRDVYKYMSLYVDDLCFIISDPEAFLKELKSNSVHDFKLKGSSEVNFHLGFADSPSTLDRTTEE